MKLTRIFSSMENLQQNFLIIFWFDWKYHSSKTFLIWLESRIQYGCQGKLYFLNYWIFKKKKFLLRNNRLGWTKTMTTIPHLRSKMATLQDIVYHRTFWENVYKKLFFPETTYLIDPKLYRNYQWRFLLEIQDGSHCKFFFYHLKWAVYVSLWFLIIPRQWTLIVVLHFTVFKSVLSLL